MPCLAVVAPLHPSSQHWPDEAQEEEVEAALEPLHLHPELPKAAVQEAVEASKNWEESQQEAPSQ